MSVTLSDNEAEELIRRLRSAEEYLATIIKYQRALEWELKKNLKE